MSGTLRARRLPVAVLATVACGLALPQGAAAHGLVGRADLPVPQWLFAYAATLVLVISFVALAVLWPSPKLQRDRWRPLGSRLALVLAAPPLEHAAQAVGALLLALVVWAGLSGTQDVTYNLTPTFVYVIFWLGLVPASVLLGDVFRALNPWRAIGRAYGWLIGRVAGGRLIPIRPYPERLGYWPAALTIVCFATLELVAAGGDSPRNLAIATLIYSVLTLLAMAVFGVDVWLDRGEGFSVYFNLFARISPFERRDGRLGLRPPLAGLPRLAARPGLVALLGVMIGTVSFDGATAGALWQEVVPPLRDAFESLGLPTRRAFELTFGLGMAAAIAGAVGFYRLGIAGARSAGGELGAARLAGAFAHSLVPIALAYVAAHYLSLLAFQGQAIVFLASDPLGRGWDLFGTASSGIDYAILSATAIW